MLAVALMCIYFYFYLGATVVGAASGGGEAVNGAPFARRPVFPVGP